MSRHKYTAVSVSYRSMGPSDAGFVFNSWLKSFRENSDWAKSMTKTIFFENHKRIVTRLLKDSQTIIAANPESPDQIFGYAVFDALASDATLLHWIYVKHPYRRLGIGADIFDKVKALTRHDQESPIIASHMTTICDLLFSKFNVHYNPYAIHGEVINEKSPVHQMGKLG